MKKRIFLFIFIIFALIHTHAKDIYFKHLSTSDGLSQPSTISIWQDQLGNMWFGNDMLNKYDGNVIKTYRLSDYIEGIQDANIKQIYGTRQSLLYILANTELIIYNIFSDKFIKTGIEADCIFLKDDQLYFSLKSDIYTYDPDSGETKSIIHLPNQSLTIKSILSLNNDEFWIGTNKGLYVVRTDKSIECIIENENISCLFQDSQKNMWAGTTSNGIRLINFKTGDIQVFKENIPLSPNNKLNNDHIRCINEDDKQNIWIGTYGGATVFSLQTQTSLSLIHNESASYSLPHNSIYSIFKDRQGTMWVGSYYGGVSYFNPNIELYTYYGTSKVDKTMLNGYIIGNMTEDENNNLYIATEEGGLNFLNRQTGLIKRYDKENGYLPHNTIKSIWFDKKYGNLFIGTFTEGLLVKERGYDQFKLLGKDILSTINQKIISQIIPYDDESLIISTQGGIYKLGRRSLEVKELTDMPELSYDEIGIIHSIYVDSDNILWISTSNKRLIVADLNKREVHPFDLPNTNTHTHINNSIIIKIRSAPDGTIYFLTGKGILTYNKPTKQTSFIGQSNGLPFSNNCHNFISLPSGNILITLDKSVTLYNPKEQKSVYLPFAKVFPLKSINASCGLYVSPLNNEIYIGGVGGMLTLFEKDIITMSAPDKYSYQLFFSTISINNKLISTTSNPNILSEDISFTKSIELNHKQNNISITFASSDFMHTNSVSYEYILENFDQQWTITNDKIIRYTSLPPGNYKLIVREVNNKEQKAQLDFVITPPFYTSGWAYIIYSVIVVSILLYIVHFMQRNAFLKASLKMEHREKAHMAELNQMKVNFFTNISHEFRTPLTLISSQIDITLNNANFSQSIKNRFLKIRKHTKEMQLLINELMHFNKLEHGAFPIKASRQDITPFINEIYNSFKDHAQIRNITYTFEYADEQIEVWFDSVQLQKVMNSLLSNAFKFTNEFGEIKIGLKRRKDYVEITVQDSGIGIKEDDLKKIFERFYQSNNQHSVAQSLEGMGIGLALSRNIINQHHGEIFATSKANEMTCFTVILLLGDTHFSEQQKGTWTLDEAMYTGRPQESELYISEEINEHANYDKSKASILIIENNEELTQLLTEAFSPIYNILIAYDGETGLNMAIENKPDIVLSDIMIPRLSGLDVCRKIKSHAATSHIPVILITARSSMKQNIEGLQYGADDYIVKPFDLELLLLKCNNLVKSRKELQTKFSKQPSENIELATNSVDQRFLEESNKVLESSLTNLEFDTNIWAKELNIGRSKLFNKVKDITGHTPNEYLIIFKMKKAEVLLKEKTNMTIAEIAYQLGFSSPGYFSKCFKEQFGITPAQFRNN